MSNTADNSWGPASGFESMNAMARSAMEAYERTLNLVQTWSEGIMSTYREQSESYAAMLISVDKSLRAMEQVVENQAKTTKALAESLDASRQVVTAAMSSNQHSTERVETFVSEVLEVLNGQVEAVRNQVELGQKMLSTPASGQGAMFTKMAQDWTDAYSRLLDATSPFKAPKDK
jgi:archaellum component FlaC